MHTSGCVGRRGLAGTALRPARGIAPGCPAAICWKKRWLRCVGRPTLWCTTSTKPVGLLSWTAERLCRRLTGGCLACGCRVVHVAGRGDARGDTHCKDLGVDQQVGAKSEGRMAAAAWWRVRPSACGAAARRPHASPNALAGDGLVLGGDRSRRRASRLAGAALGCCPLRRQWCGHATHVPGGVGGFSCACGAGLVTRDPARCECRPSVRLGACGPRRPAVAGAAGRKPCVAGR